MRWLDYLLLENFWFYASTAERYIMDILKLLKSYFLENIRFQKRCLKYTISIMNSKMSSIIYFRNYN